MYFNVFQEKLKNMYFWIVYGIYIILYVNINQNALVFDKIENNILNICMFCLVISGG